MANDKQHPELDSLAFEIFKQAVAHSPVSRGVETQAFAAYRKAEAFIAVRERVRAGEAKVVKPEGPQLADCFCPNLKRNHPYNLVSQKLGDLEKVNRISQWLNKNPTPESDPQELIARINREFPGLDWDMPTVNTARNIFPEYAKS